MAPNEPPKVPRPAVAKDRQTRRAEALRENLKRRKSQARDRRDNDPKGTPSGT